MSKVIHFLLLHLAGGMLLALLLLSGLVLGDPHGFGRLLREDAASPAPLLLLWLFLGLGFSAGLLATAASQAPEPAPVRHAARPRWQRHRGP